MITPNLCFKLVAIFFFVVGLTLMYILNGLDKILGAFMVTYSYINLLSLRNKGKHKFKKNLLKINCIVLLIFLLFFIYKIELKNNKNLELYKVVIMLFSLLFICNIVSTLNFYPPSERKKLIVKE